MLNRIVTSITGEKVYITIDGDVVDAIAYKYYGKHGKNTEALLEANPDLFAYGPVLPAGLRIVLPPSRRKNRLSRSRLCGTDRRPHGLTCPCLLPFPPGAGGEPFI
ncbi:hypothetical protein DEA98_09830 [Brucella pseudogrignonensis]|nr:hypothetical protein [Brucella pseudogrignonensis]